jgi:hypothetical protein
VVPARRQAVPRQLELLGLRRAQVAQRRLALRAEVRAALLAVPVGSRKVARVAAALAVAAAVVPAVVAVPGGQVATSRARPTASLA